MKKLSVAVVFFLVTADAFARNWPLYQRVHCAGGDGAAARVSESVNAEVTRLRVQHPDYTWNPKVTLPSVTTLANGSAYVCVTVSVE